MEQEFLLEQLRRDGREIPEFLLSPDFFNYLDSAGFELPSAVCYEQFLSHFRDRNQDAALYPIAKSQVNDDTLTIQFKDDSGRIVMLHDFSGSGTEHWQHFNDFDDWIRSIGQAG